MAYTYTWPEELPQSPQKGFTEVGGVLVIRTPQDAGPAKIRRKGSKPQVLNLSFLMTNIQVALLENFIKNTINGVARFGFTHPRTQNIEECRVVPQDSGDYYTLTYAAPDYYTVTITLEIMP